SFDHLVGAQEDRRREHNSQTPCRLQVDDKFERGGQFSGQLGGLSTAQYFGNQSRALPEGLIRIDTIRNHPAGSRKIGK
ncbi:MAG TPA: hypothetical protein VKB89_31015, partial [Xanthobacteraceae bacterium]|nr:hypothetical protein [Xanthobacteraceae bacterium]